MRCADLGASVLAPDGALVSVFGDTFAGERVGRGDWRSPAAGWPSATLVSGEAIR